MQLKHKEWGNSLGLVGFPKILQNGLTFPPEF